MPLAVEKLTADSPMGTIREAISSSVEACIKEGKEPDQCAAMAYDIAREKTGKEIGERG